MDEGEPNEESEGPNATGYDDDHVDDQPWDKEPSEKEKRTTPDFLRPVVLDGSIDEDDVDGDGEQVAGDDAGHVARVARDVMANSLDKRLTSLISNQS